MKNKITVFSFFSGAGLLDLGFEASGFDVAFVNEISENFLNAYKHARRRLNLPQPRFGHFNSDVGSFLADSGQALKSMIASARKDSSLVGFIGGPPCPDFSVSGLNKGSKGRSGKLSRVYIELIRQHRPDFFVFENVKGLYRTKKHRRYYDSLKRELQKAGYVTTNRITNALEYGVPQSRERLILVGFRKHILTKLHIPLPKGNEFIEEAFPWDTHTSYSKEDLIGYPWPQKSKFSAGSSKPKPRGIPKELTAEHWFRTNRVVDHPNASHQFQPKAGLKRFKSVAEGDSFGKSYKRLHRWKFSPAACYGNNEVHLHPYLARRLSVAEALAIQSMPREFELPNSMSLSDMFKVVGNGVPYLAAKGIANTLRDFVLGRIHLKR